MTRPFQASRAQRSGTTARRNASSFAAFVLFVSVAAPLDARAVDGPAEAVTNAPWVSAPFAPDAGSWRSAASALAVKDAPDGWTLLWSESRVEIDAEHRVKERFRTVTYVQTENAVSDLASASLDWNPTWHNAPVLRARVIERSGKVRDFDPSRLEVEESGLPSHDMYTGTRVSRAPLPGVAVGAILETEWTLEEHTPTTTAGRLMSLYAWTGSSVLGGSLSLVSPEATPITVRVENLDGARSDRQSADGKVTQRWLYGPFRMPDASWAPSDSKVFAGVFASTGQSWASVAAGYAAVFEPKVDTAAVAALAKEIAGGEKDPLLAATKLMARIRKDVRYEGIELGMGALVPREPMMVLNQGYGDCKDQAALLISMMRSLGFPAKAVLLRAGRWFDIHTDLPSQDAFDHVIVQIPGKTPRYVDPTDRFGPLAVLPYADTGRQVLVIDAATKGLSRTPAAVAMENRRVIELFYEPKAHGFGALRRVETAYGRAAAEDRQGFQSMTPEGLTDALENWVEENYGEEPSTKLVGLDDAEAALELETRSAKTPLTDVADSDAAMTVRLSDLLASLPSILHTAEEKLTDKEKKKQKEKEAKQPGPPVPERVADYVYAPMRVETHVHVPLRRGWEGGKLPEPLDIKVAGLTLTSKWESSKDTITGTFVLDTGPGRFTIKEWKQVRDELSKMVERGAPAARLSHRPFALAADGKVTEAVQEMDAVLKAEPDEVEHAVQRALLLIDAGLGEVGRDILEGLTKDPRVTARIWHAASDAQRRDSLGRLIGADKLRRDPLPALRKAIELEPDREAWRVDLASRLCETKVGRKEGVELYEALLAEGLAENQKNAALTCLLRDDRLDDAIAFAEDHNVEEMPTLLSLLKFAATDGVAETAKKLDTMGVRGKDAMTVWTVLMGLSVAMDDGPLTADLMLQGLPSDDPKRAIIEAVAKVDPRELDDVDRRTPEGAARRAFQSHFPGNDAYKDALDIRHPNHEERKPAEEDQGDDVAFGKFDSLLKLVMGAIRPVERSKYKDLSLLALESPMAANDDSRAFVAERRKDGWVMVADFTESDTVGVRLELLAAEGRTGEMRWLADQFRPVAERTDPPAARACVAWAEHAGKDGLAQCFRALGGGKGWKDLYDASVGKDDAWMEKLYPVLAMGALWELQAPELVADFAGRAMKFEQHRDSAIRFTHMALLKLGRLADAETSARAWLSEQPGDARVLRNLGEILIRLGREREADAELQRFVKKKADVNTLNAFLWNRLFLGDLDKETLDFARTLAEDQEAHAAGLHTVAAVYAEVGQVGQAMDTLKRAVHIKDAPLDSSNRYVVARVAEQLGLLDVAKGEYQRVIVDGKKEDPKGEVAQPTWKLAERRLKAMAK